MFKAAGRIILIFVGVLFAGILVLFGLRSLGQTDAYAPPFEDDFYQKSFWLININNWEKPSLAETLKTLPEKAIVGADLQGLADGEIVIFPEHFISLEGRTRFLTSLSLTDLRTTNPGVLTLEEFLNITGDRPLYLRTTHLNRINGSELVKKIIAHRPKGPLILQVANQALRKKIKEDQPNWIFVNTASEIGKLKVFAAFWIEPLVTLDADAYVLKVEDSQLIEEIHRRKRKVLLFTTPGPENIQVQNVDGVIVTSRPENFPSSLLERVDKR